MEQLLAHLVGDYILQNHTMATKKLSSFKWALIHGFFYTLPFLFLTDRLVIFLGIWLTHAIIDRWRLANWIARVKNWEFEQKSGYPEGTPIWLTTVLMIVTDNTMHLLINYFLLKIR